MNVMRGQISCKQAVNLISRKEEGKLSAVQRFKLWRHLVACSLCRIFSVQNKIIQEAIKHQPTIPLASEEKERIIKTVLAPGGNEPNKDETEGM
jgi:hypothetical protein